jgi:3-dehydroquinate synthase
MKKIKVNLNRKISASYEILIGRNILDRAGMILQRNNWADRYFLAADETVASLHGERTAEILKSAGLSVEALTLPAGETAKTMDTALSVVDGLLRRGADRSSGIIALGGGVTGDVVGFAASIYMRGIPCIQIPTTLVAQVDSSIGGKTGVNREEGKNLVGAFHQPKAVVIDMEYLQTLPEREFRNGLAEAVKYGIIDDPGLFEILESESETILGRDMDRLSEVVSRSCSIKKAIVEIDERELGIRKILNFGHTVGHALERESDGAIPHGEAVAAGMIAAAAISEKMGYLPSADRLRIEGLIRRMGLYRPIPPSLSTEGVLSRIRYDKKKKGGEVSFVLLKKIGIPFSNGAVEGKVIAEAVEALRKE